MATALNAIFPLVRRSVYCRHLFATRALSRRLGAKCNFAHRHVREIEIDFPLFTFSPLALASRQQKEIN